MCMQRSFENGSHSLFSWSNVRTQKILHIYLITLQFLAPLPETLRQIQRMDTSKRNGRENTAVKVNNQLRLRSSRIMTSPVHSPSLTCVRLHQTRVTKRSNNSWYLEKETYTIKLLQKHILPFDCECCPFDPPKIFQAVVVRNGKTPKFRGISSI